MRATNAVDESAWTTRWFSTSDQILNLPSAPELVSPENNSEFLPTSLTLDWSNSTNATAYVLNYSQTPDFSTFTEVNISESQAFVEGLADNTTYFWRIYATDGTNISDWSEVWSFATGQLPLEAPILQSPSDLATNQETTLSLDWQTVTNAENYNYQYSTDNSFATYSQGNVSANNVEISGLDFSTEYFWRVKAINSEDESEWSEVWSFETMEMPLGTPLLISPANNSTGIQTDVTLIWQQVENAETYEYLISNDETFATSSGGQIVDTQAELTGLDFNTTYYWKVRANKTGETSDWSEVWNFTTTDNTINITEFSDKILIYPNPAKNFINFEIRNDKIAKLIIYNSTGKAYESDENQIIDISKFPTGTYFVKIITESGKIYFESVIKI